MDLLDESEVFVPQIKIGCIGFLLRISKGVMALYELQGCGTVEL